MLVDTGEHGRLVLHSRKCNIKSKEIRYNTVCLKHVPILAKAYWVIPCQVV